NADNTERLIDNARFRRQEMNSGCDTSWLHPLRQMLSRVADGIDQRREFQKQGFLADPSAEILIGGADYFVLLPEQGGFQRLERTHALVVIGHATMKGGALQVKQIAQASAPDDRRVPGTSLPGCGHGWC